MSSQMTKDFSLKSKLRKLADGGSPRPEMLGSGMAAQAGSLLSGRGRQIDAAVEEATAPRVAPKQDIPATPPTDKRAEKKGLRGLLGLADGGDGIFSPEEIDNFNAMSGQAARQNSGALEAAEAAAQAGRDAAAAETQRAAEFRGFAHGGRVNGPGGRTDDKVGPVMLSNKEYVLPGDTADAIGRDNLDAIRLATHDFKDSKKESALRKDVEGLADGGSLPKRPNAFGDAAAGPGYVQPKMAAFSPPPPALPPTPPSPPAGVPPSSSGGPLAPRPQGGALVPNPEPAGMGQRGPKFMGMVDEVPRTQLPSPSPAAPQKALGYTPPTASAGGGPGISPTMAKWGGRAGAIGTAIGAAMEGKNVLDVAADKDSSKIDVATQAAEGVGRLGAAGAGAGLGAKAGAALGTAIFPGVGTVVGGALGGLGGGALGYFGADKAIELNRDALGVDTRSPIQQVRDRSAERMADADKATKAQAAPQYAEQPYAAANAAKLAEFAESERARVKAGLAPTYDPGQARADLGYGPIGDRRLLTNEQAAVMNPAGKVTATRQPNGTMSFSGVDVAGQVSYHDGEGKALQGGGLRGKGFSNFDVAPAGADIAMGPNGSYAFATSGSGVRTPARGGDPNSYESMLQSTLRGLGGGAGGQGATGQGGGYQGPVSNAAAINARYDKMAKELSGMYSAKGRGNLARRLESLENQRSNALDADARNITMARNNETTNATSRENAALQARTSLIGTMERAQTGRLTAESTLRAKQMEAEEKRLERADTKAREDAKIGRETEEKGFERLNKSIDRMFTVTGPDGKETVGKAAQENFRAFLEANDPEMNGQKLMSMPAQQQQAWVQKFKKLHEMQGVRNDVARNGSWPGTARGVTGKVDMPVEKRESKFSDYWNKGLPFKDYLRSFVGDNQVVVTESGQPVLYSDYASSDGEWDLDKQQIVQQSVKAAKERKSKLRNN